MRRARRILALFAAFALLFSQIAAAAYPCAGPSPAMATAMHAAQPMEGCDEMNSPPSPLCLSHCGPAAQSLDKPPAPSVPPAVFIGNVAWALEALPACDTLFHGERDARSIPPPEPPATLRNCCLRI